MERCLLKGTSLFLFVFVAGAVRLYAPLGFFCIKNVSIE